MFPFFFNFIKKQQQKTPENIVDDSNNLITSTKLITYLKI